jgi:outer membrane receptor protein involved in Fe transport
MSKPLALGGLLLISTALVAPSALAQVTGGDQPAAASTTDAASDVSVPGGIGAEIIVTGRNVPDIVRTTPQVVSLLSTAEIARTGEGDVAGALQRVTGLSVVGNGYVYVRGLGDRYSLALLNGSPLPSPEPLKRVVPLDIFPTSVVASALVQKSYSVNYPGEFGGGVINLTTSAIPTETFFNFGIGGSGDTETTGEVGYTYYGSRTDWTGFDNGTRDLPRALRNAFDSGNLVTEGVNFSRRDIQDVAASLVNSATSVVQTNRDIPANFSTDFSIGTAFDAGDVRLGVIASGGYSNSWRTRDSRQQISGGFVGEDLLPDVDFRSVVTDNRIVVNGLLGLGAEFDEHKLRWTNLYIRDTIKQARISRGSDGLSGDPDIPVINQNSYWFERQLIDTQFVGEFKFGDFGVDLRGTYANSQRESPYERSFSYSYNALVDDFVNDLRSVNQSARIAFSDLNENVYAGGADLSYALPTERSITLSAGYAYTKTDRNAVRREFRFLPAGDLPAPLAQLRPDFLLSDYNIYNFDILLVETSGQAGAAAYDAGLTVNAGYGQLVAEVVPGVTATVGVRYEDAKQFVTPIDLFGGGATGVASTTLRNDYWLPAATVTWNFADDMQLRVNASKTLARPQFRELAFQIYQDNESDRQFFGNPFLVDSKLTNAEARYEWYFAQDQRFSLAGFYKKIDNPIETFAFRSSSLLQTSFANAPEAQLYGAEVEALKYLPLDTMFSEGWLSTRRIILSANYTYTKSKIKVGDGDNIIFATGSEQPARDFFTNGDPLTGQSDHIANLQIGLENVDRLSQQTFLISYASKRVTNRGPSGSPQQPDIVEKPGLRLDFVAREAFEFMGANMEGKLEVRNITGRKYQEFQQAGASRIDINTYDVGTSLSLGVELKF